MIVRLLPLVLILLQPLSVCLAQEDASREDDASSQAAKELFEKFEALLEDGEPAYTTEEAEALIAELLPLVEEAAGREFSAPPTLVVADTKTVRQALARDLAPQLESLGQGMSAEKARAAAKAQARMLAPLLLGKWGFVDQKIYLLPHRVKPLAALVGIEPEHEQALVKLVIAHELVHTLQDQETELAERFIAFSGVDRSMAFNALIEGHAVFVAGQVGEKLGLSAQEIESCNRLLSGAVSLGDPTLDMLSKIGQSQFEQTYLGGARFCAHHHEQGGNERLWQILAAPPTNTAMIASPETYSSEIIASLDLGEALKGFEELFGETEWIVQNIEIGNLLLASVYAGMDEDDREQILDQVTQTQTLVALDPGNPNVMGNVSLIRIRDPDFAGSYLEKLKTMAEANVERIKQGGLVRIKHFEFGGLQGFECDLGQRVDLDIEIGGDLSVQHIYRAVRDNVVVELIDSNLGLTHDTLLELLEEGFARHDAVVAAAASQEQVPVGADG